MEKWEGGHRVGFDLTISAPGDVSVAFALADDREKLAILEAHRQACAVAMRYIESKVETRRGEAGVDVIGTAGLVWTAADHVSNRNVEPDLHTHHLVYGISRGEDGRWGTYDAIEIYRHTPAARHWCVTRRAKPRPACCLPWGASPASSTTWPPHGPRLASAVSR
ncbi:TPA: relaxase domain-containing protein [Stenotrophomonas maltophilia]